MLPYAKLWHRWPRSWIDSKHPRSGSCTGLKAPTSVVLDRVNGSRGFTAAARAVLAVGEDAEDKSHRVLVLAKSNLGRLDVPALRYEVEGRTITTPDAEEIATYGLSGWARPPA